MDKTKYIFRILGHDLGNNLNHILGFFSLYNQVGEEIPEIKKLGKKAEKSAKETWNLLNEMFLWSQSDSLQKINLSLFEICEEVIAFFDGNHPQKTTHIENFLPKDIYVFSDKIAVKTILRNLIGNAIKFSPADGVVTISIDAGKIPQGKVCVSVQDTGIGIPKNLQEKIFLPVEEKVRIDAYGKKSTGLGMLIIKDFIDELEEKIFIESEEGKGTTFFFTLPLSCL